MELPWHVTVTWDSDSDMCLLVLCEKCVCTLTLILILIRIIFTTLSRDCGSLLFRRWFSWSSADSRRLRARRGWRGEYCECEYSLMHRQRENQRDIYVGISHRLQASCCVGKWRISILTKHTRRRYAQRNVHGRKRWRPWTLYLEVLLFQCVTTSQFDSNKTS